MHLRGHTGPTTEQLIIEFFERNPCEDMTQEDMMVKFGRSERAIQQALTDLKKRGVIERSVVYHPVRRGR